MPEIGEKGGGGGGGVRRRRRRRGTRWEDEPPTCCPPFNETLLILNIHLWLGVSSIRLLRFQGLGSKDNPVTFIFLKNYKKCVSMARCLSRSVSDEGMS